jgi:outer membrane protein assembly factor BamD
MKKFQLPVIIAVLILLVSCASGTKIKEKHLYDCSGKLIEGIEKFEKKRYSSAQVIFSDIITKCPGHSANDTTIYYLAKTWLAMNKPDEAKVEFEHLALSFPSSVYNEEARYFLGYSSFLSSSPWYLDQTSTKEAQHKLKSFLEANPQSRFADSARLYIDKCNNKLAEKEFHAANFYEKTDHYEAAIVYYKYIIDEFPESPFAAQSKLLIAQDLIALSRNSEAIAFLDEIIEQSKDDSIVKKAASLRQKAAKKQL